LPILQGSFGHGFGGFVEPAGFALGEIAFDLRDGGGGAEMHVGGFPAHGVEEAGFVAFGGEGGEFDAGAVGSEAANEPASVKADEGIGNAFSAGGKLRAVEKLFGFAFRPDPGGGANGFGFARQESAAVAGDGEDARMAEAAETGDAAFELIAAFGRKRFFE